MGAIDIGGTKIGVGLVEDSGRLVARSDISTRHATSVRVGTATIKTVLRQLGASTDLIGAARVWVHRFG